MVTDAVSRNSLDQSRLQFTRVLAVIAIFLSIGGLIAQTATAVGGEEEFSIFGMLFIITFLLINVFALWLTFVGRANIAANILIGLFILSYLRLTDIQIDLLLGTLSIVAASLLTRKWMFIAINIVVIGKLVLILGLLGIENDWEITNEGLVLSVDLSALILFSVTFRFFITAAQRIADRAQKSANLLQATAEVGQATAQLLDLTDLYKHSAELIRDRFAYYHVQLFMYDEESNRVKRVATTEAQPAQQEVFVSSGISIISHVMQTGTPAALSANDQQSSYTGELLPDARSELVLPIRVGERVSGVLDIQSRRTDVFDVTEIQALEVIAAQLGGAIRNARLFAQQEKNVEENKRLFLESEINLREIQRLNQQLTGQVWKDYLADKDDQYSGIVIDKSGTKESPEWTATMLEAGQHKRPIQAEDAGHIVAVPVVLRGEVIGVIEVEGGEDVQQADVRNIVQSVSNRLAISLDNARLFEEAHQATVQEQRLNEIASQYDTANTVDELLEITLASLSETLGAKRSKIRLGSPNGVHNS